MISPPGIPSDSTPASPLMEEEEEEAEPCRKNLDQSDTKTPNILIYAANNSDYFNSVKYTLHQCINQERLVGLF